MAEEIATTAGTPAESTLPNKSWIFLIGLALSAMMSGLSSVCIKQLLLPIQVGQIAPGNTYLIFTLVSSLGAFAGLLATPLIGALSDRTSWRYGRRKPWIAAGISIAVTGMLTMAWARTFPLLLTGEILSQIGVDTVLAMTTALIPDLIPPAQRFLISACVGMAPNVGGVIGLLLVSRFTDTRVIAEGYVLVAAASLLCVGFFLIILRDPPVAHDDLPSFHLGEFLVGFVQPLRVRDFCLTFISRCFAYLAFTILGAYTLFYLEAKLHATTPEAAIGVSNFQLLSTAFLVAFAIIAGVLSKRTGRIRPFALGGAIAMGVGLGVLVAFPTWTALPIAAVLFGAGFGLYLGVDIFLAVRVLPSARSRGKDLGLIYNAVFLPLILSPIIGGMILHFFPGNFALLFAIAAFSCILSAVFIIPIKTVR